MWPLKWIHWYLQHPKTIQQSLKSTTDILSYGINWMMSMGLCNKSETISNILKLRTISKPRKDQAQGGLFGHHPKRSKKNEDFCLRHGLFVTCLRMFWVRKFKTHFVRVWQETYWYRIQMNPAGSARVEFFTLHLSPNSFSYPQPVLPRIGSVISLDLSPSLALIHLNGRQRIALCSLGAKMLAEIRSG